MSDVTRESALAELRHLAAGVRDLTDTEATATLLQRVTATADPEGLRSALAEVGARALLTEARVIEVVTGELGHGGRP